MLRQPSSPVCLPSLLVTSGLIKTIRSGSFPSSPPVMSITVIRFENTDLRCGQTYPMRSVHGFEHVLYKLMQFGGVEVRDRASAGRSSIGSVQIFDDPVMHQKFRTCSR